MSNDIDALREHLFATIAGLSDKTAPMDIDRAKAISEIAQTIINSAKVEVDFIRATGAKESAFLSKKPELPQGITGTLVHRIR